MGLVCSRFLAHLPATASLHPQIIPPKSLFHRTLPVSPTGSRFCRQSSKQTHCFQDFGHWGWGEGVPVAQNRAPLELAPAIMMIMLAAGGINMLAFRASPVAAVKGTIMNAGVVALISIAGLGWLGSSFFEGNRQVIVASISGVVQQHPWVFAFGLFALSILLSSQAATVVTLMPVGVALGLGAPALIAMFPAVNGYFFLPTYATLLAAISFDQTGTTKIGKYVLNHSFMRPGLVATISSVLIGFVMAKLVL